MANSFPSFAVVTTAALSFALVVNPAEAASFSFQVDVTTGPLTSESYTGLFSVDDTALTGVGLETIELTDSEAFQFDFAGQTYLATANLPNFPLFPIVQFLDGGLVGLNFSAADFLSGDEFFIGDELDQNQAGSDFAYAAAGGSGQGGVTYTAIPEPGAAAGLGVVVSLGLFLKKRKSSQSA